MLDVLRDTRSNGINAHRINPNRIVILNLFQDNAPPSPVILKQVQDDEFWASVLNNEFWVSVLSDDIGAEALNDEFGAEALNDDIGVGVLKQVQDDEAGAFSR